MHPSSAFARIRRQGPIARRAPGEILRAGLLLLAAASPCAAAEENGAFTVFSTRWDAAAGQYQVLYAQELPHAAPFLVYGRDGIRADWEVMGERVASGPFLRLMWRSHVPVGTTSVLFQGFDIPLPQKNALSFLALGQPLPDGMPQNAWGLRTGAGRDAPLEPVKVQFSLKRRIAQCPMGDLPDGQRLPLLEETPPASASQRMLTAKERALSPSLALFGFAADYAEVLRQKLPAGWYAVFVQTTMAKEHCHVDAAAALPIDVGKPTRVSAALATGVFAFAGVLTQAADGKAVLDGDFSITIPENNGCATVSIKALPVSRPKTPAGGGTTRETAENGGLQCHHFFLLHASPGPGE